MDISLVGEWQMLFVFAVIIFAIVSYSLERISLEMTSLIVVLSLLTFFHMFPLSDAEGINLLGAGTLLAGFADPALITILGLLVIGQGLFQTGALESPTRMLAAAGGFSPRLILFLTFAIVVFVSAFMNNTPVVVMFIPIIAAFAARTNQKASKVMMPLSFVSILGGMTTLIGSSTNLLVDGVVRQYGLPPINFFDFTVPGVFLASVGVLYVVLSLRLLPEREELVEDFASTGDGRQYIAEIPLTPDHPLVGTAAVAGLFPPLKDMTVRMIQRGETHVLPPFEDVILEIGDVVVVAATRKSLTEALKSSSDIMRGLISEHVDELAGEAGELTIAEAVVAPGSRMIGRTLGQVGFRAETSCIIVGIQRRSRMIRTHMDDIRLEPGDVLLVLGRLQNIQRLRANRDVLLLEWSAAELPEFANARWAATIFAGTILLAATAVIPIVIAALLGATLMIATNCLNIRQAGRAIDRRIIFIIAAALAMGHGLAATGGAAAVAQSVVQLFSGTHPAVLISVFFLMVATMTNILSNNATAVLFTPIAINTAVELGIDPMILVYTVIFAANCSFATPIAYQTNLLVMGPGHYRFSDFVRAGTPLIFLLWIAYSFFAPWYYELL